MKPRWPVALFDLDGTLTDPEEGIIRCIQHAFAALDQPVPEWNAQRDWIGPPLLSSFTAAMGDEGLATRALATYRERFADVGMFENRLIDGIDGMLGSIREGGVTAYVVTSKPAVFARQIVDHFGLTPRFRRIYGSELDGTRGDKTTLIAHVLERESIDPARAVMIGDRYHDVDGAKANGTAAIGVTWGFGSREELEGAGADPIVDTVDELEQNLRTRGDQQ